MRKSVISVKPNKKNAQKYIFNSGIRKETFFYLSKTGLVILKLRDRPLVLTCARFERKLILEP